MSSTNRGAVRMEADYYVTPREAIRVFLNHWWLDEPDAKTALKGVVMDPCAGGNIHRIEWDGKIIPPTPMSYPSVLKNYAPNQLITNDLREDSPADSHRDFLTTPVSGLVHPDLIITNPPFNIALEIIKRSFQVVKAPSRAIGGAGPGGGFIVMLLRLNFLGSAKRFPFFSDPHGYMPQRCYVHHERMSFTPDGKTDSIEYAHFVWRKGAPCRETILKVI